MAHRTLYAHRLACMTLTLALAAVWWQPLPAAAATQAEICDAMEDFALDVLDLKKAGADEGSIIRAMDLQPEHPFYGIISRLYSSDGATPEYALADARLQCLMLFMFEDDGSRRKTGDGIDPSLAPTNWIAACTKDEWLNLWRKARGTGTMNKTWDANEAEAVALVDLLWENRAAAADITFDLEGIKTLQGIRYTDFVRDIGLPAISCLRAHERK